MKCRVSDLSSQSLTPHNLEQEIAAPVAPIYVSQTNKHLCNLYYKKIIERYHRIVIAAKDLAMLHLVDRLIHQPEQRARHKSAQGL
jgi:DNA polymerase IIIc chi subunit